MARPFSMAQSLLLTGVICCGSMGVGARPPELPPGSDALAVEMRGDQLASVTSATNQKSRDLSGLTLLTSRGGDHDGYAAGPSEPFGGNLLIAPVSDLSAKWAELQSRILSEQETLGACQSDWDNCPEAARRFTAIPPARWARW